MRFFVFIRWQGFQYIQILPYVIYVFSFKMFLKEKKSRSGQTVLGHPLFRDEFFGIKKG